MASVFANVVQAPEDPILGVFLFDIFFYVLYLYDRCFYTLIICHTVDRWSCVQMIDYELMTIRKLM